MKKSIFKKKIVIGSANFTQKYGVILNKVRSNEIKLIINFAKKNNINTIDTADNYLQNFSIFKKINRNFKLISKIKPDEKWLSINYCIKKLKSQIKKLNNLKIQTLLIHDTKILFSKYGPKIFYNLEILKKMGFFKKIGISIYDTENLGYLISNYKIQVVQCPFNLLDRRIITSGWYDRLKFKKVEIHIRSIFIKGLLVNDKLYKEKTYFKKWEKKFSDWFKWLNKFEISPIDYCLSDLLNYEFDKIVIGINSKDHLQKIINFKKLKLINKTFKFNINDKKLVDPRKWE